MAGELEGTYEEEDSDVTEDSEADETADIELSDAKEVDVAAEMVEVTSENEAETAELLLLIKADDDETTEYAGIADSDKDNELKRLDVAAELAVVIEGAPGSGGCRLSWAMTSGRQASQRMCRNGMVGGGTKCKHARPGRPLGFKAKPHLIWVL